MGRIIASVRIDNASDVSRGLRCDALVDTGASLMVLPSAWKDRFGELGSGTEIDVETATQEIVRAEVCGPVRIQIDGFRPIFNEVASVDMLGHRLVPAKHMDLKSLICARASCFGNYSELPR